MFTGFIFYHVVAMISYYSARNLNNGVTHGDALDAFNKIKAYREKITGEKIAVPEIKSNWLWLGLLVKPEQALKFARETNAIFLELNEQHEKSGIYKFIKRIEDLAINEIIRNASEITEGDELTKKIKDDEVTRALYNSAYNEDERKERKQARKRRQATMRLNWECEAQRKAIIKTVLVQQEENKRLQRIEANRKQKRRA